MEVALRRHLRLRPALLASRRRGGVGSQGAAGPRSRDVWAPWSGPRRTEADLPPARLWRCIRPPRRPGAARYPEDRPNLSPGCTYLGSAARFPHTDGAFSRYVNLPTRMLRALPGDLDLRTAALIEPASVAWHAVARAGDVAGQDRPGDRLRTHRRPGRGGTEAGGGTAGSLLWTCMPGRWRSPRRSARTDVLAAGETEAIAAVEADVVIESSGSHQGLASAIQGRRPGRHRGDGGAAAVGPAARPDFTGHHPGTRAPRLIPLQRRNRRRHRRAGRRLPADRTRDHARIPAWNRPSKPSAWRATRPNPERCCWTSGRQDFRRKPRRGGAVAPGRKPAAAQPRPAPSRKSSGA